MDVAVVLELLKNNRALWVTATVTGCFAVIVSIINVIWLYFQQKKQLLIDKKLESYKNELSKDIENFKVGIEKKKYVSKVRFDTEFEVFRGLTKCFYELVKSVDALNNIPRFEDANMQNNVDQQAWDNCKNAIEKTQDLLFANNTFIPEEIDKQLENLFILCRNRFMSIPQDKEQKSVYEEWTTIRAAIRKYLQSLEVIK